MARRRSPALTDAEARVMSVLWQRQTATVADVVAVLKRKKPVTYSTVQTVLRILEDKGHLTHRHDGPRYVYSPVVPRTAARQSALKQLVKTFFDGSAPQAVAALLDMSESRLTSAEADQLATLIEKAKREGK